MNTHENNPDDPGASIGVVYKKNLGSYTVHTNRRILPCKLSTRLRKIGVEQASPVRSGRRGGARGVPRDGSDSSSPALSESPSHIDPVAIGDEVRFIDAQDGTGLIVSVLPRRNKLSRRTAVPMPSAHPFEQVIVANVDQVIPVFSAARPAPKWNLLDRYLVTAEAAEIPAAICISKLDLLDEDEEFRQTIAEYREIGYPVYLTSIITGEGLDEIKTALQGRFSVFLGKSGVGKTSLLNSLQGLQLPVNEVNRKTFKGKHTTSHLEMYPLDFGGIVADTPGVREFGCWDIQGDDLAHFFPEMRPFLGRCKFGLGCRHDGEPGCAIRQAVVAGRISPHRYQSYVRLKEDLA